MLKGSKNFEWGPECQREFEEVKEYLTKAPLLMRPDPKETLQLYLAVSDRTLGMVLVKNYEGNQHPVFYVSHVFKDIETSQPLKKILTRPEASRRVVAWSIELGEFNLEYVPKTAIKAQALADFVVECTFSGPKDLTPDEQLIRIPGKWKLFEDGSVAEKKCGAGLILSSPEGFEICQAIRFDFPLTNNEAEYEALLAVIELARSLEAKHLRAFSKSMLVVKHFMGEYEENNARADALSRLASAETQNLTGSIYLTEAKMPSIEKKECLEIHQGSDWMSPLRSFLEKGILPPDRRKALKINTGHRATASATEG
ncbi:uncharacterized protein LOC141714714 [Apium graveolens]|uniref:uncharacterized protein LOC141714714 n=1 Tax=Apium graveolens TaxID=4045 RepID=UPI003D7B7479